MKQVLAFFMMLLVLASCTSRQQQASEPVSPFRQYVDSITKAHPNYSGNIAVQKMIGEDFLKHITPFPGILEGVSFSVVNMGETAGKTIVMFSSYDPSLYLWCEDYGTEKAAQLDTKKSYKIAGGTFDRYEPVEGVANAYLQLGSVFVRDLAMEEVK